MFRLPPRVVYNLSGDTGVVFTMPGSADEVDTFGAKLVSFLPQNLTAGKPVVSGLVALFDRHTGQPRAIIDGRAITDIRTAATSAMATRYLARKDAGSCGIFGTGGQADSHIDAICAVRPVEDIVIWGRSYEKAQALAERHAQRHGVNTRATQDPAEAGACDIVCTVTGSLDPILKGVWVKPGAHVCLVGAHGLNARESDTELIVKSRVYVDYIESTLNEGGEIMIPIGEGSVDESHIVGEIGEVLTGKIGGRATDDEITVYNSLGVVSQDLYAASYILRQAVAEGAGTTVAF